MLLAEERRLGTDFLVFLLTDADMTSIGDFNNLTSTAAVMLKTSIFSAWAELQCASTAQPHLAPLMQPYLSLLCPAWLTTLKQYARLRSDADSVATSPATSSPGSQSFENSFSGLSREAALPVRPSITWLS